MRIRTQQRNADAFCRLAGKCVAHSARLKRRVILVTDRARFHCRETSRQVAELLDRHDRHLHLRYVPSYSPECNPAELLWNDWRHYVTHDHDRSVITDLEQDSDRYFRRRARNKRVILRTIGSPFQKRRNRKN